MLLNTLFCVPNFSYLSYDYEMKNNITEILGRYWIVAIVGAYALLSFNIIVDDSLLYQGLNLTGAIGVVVDALDDKNTQPAVLNIIWAVIAFIAILKIVF